MKTLNNKTIKLALLFVLAVGMTDSLYGATSKSNAKGHRDPSYKRIEDVNLESRAAILGSTSEPGFETMVVVDCRVEDRPKFEAMIDKNYPGAKKSYTSVNTNVDMDVRMTVESGLRQYYCRGPFKNLVVISSFKVANVGFENEPKAVATSRWQADFAAAKKDEGPRLILLSTEKDPPYSYLRFVRASGGEYRKLLAGTGGNYE